MAWVAFFPFVAVGAEAGQAYDLGIHFFERQSYQVALAQFDKAMVEEQEMGKRTWVSWYRARCLEVLNRMPEALRAYDEFYREAPQHPYADRALLYAALIEYREVQQVPQDSQAARYEGVIGRLSALQSGYPQSSVLQEAIYWKGEACYASNRDEEALIQYDLLIEGKAGRYESHAWYSKGRVLFRLGRYDPASEAFRRVTQLNEPSLAVVGRYWLAECAYQKKSYREAIQGFRAALQSTLSLGYEELAWYRLGECQIKQSIFGEGVETFDQFLKIFWKSPSHLSAWYWKGVGLLESGKPLGSVEPLTEFTKASTDEMLLPYGWYALGLAYYRLGRLPEAVGAWGHGASGDAAHPMTVHAIHASAATLFQLNRYAEAKNQFEQLLTHEDLEFRASALYWTGWCEVKLKEAREAELTFTTFVERFPQHRFIAEAYLMLGELAFQQKNFKKARESYDLVRQRSSHPSAQALAAEGLAWLEIEGGRMDRAIIGLQEAVKLAADDALKIRMTETLAQVLFNQRRYGEAGGYYRTLVNQAMAEEDRVRVRRQWGWCLFHSGQPDAAIRAWEELKTDEGLWLMGKAQLGMNRPTEAAKTFRGLIERYPKSVWTSQALLREGDALYNAQAYERAVASYRAALNRHLPDELKKETLYGLALCFERLGHRAEEVAVKKQFVATFPAEKASQTFQWDIGDRLRDQGEFTQAVLQYQSAMKTAPLLGGWLRIAQCHLSLGVFDEAVSAYTQYLREAKGKDRLPGLMGVAAVWLNTGQTEAVAAPLMEIWEIAPLPAKTWAAQQLATVHRGRNQDEEAIALWQWIVAQSSDELAKSNARWAMARHWMDRKQYAEALLAWDDLIRAEPASRVKAGLLKGQALTFLLRWEEAAKAYGAVAEAAVTQEEDRVTAWARAAECFEQLKQWDQAKAWYQRIAKEATREDWKLAAQKRLELLTAALEEPVRP